MPHTPPGYDQILRVLADHQVEYIVVGGIAAILHGALQTTTDLDIVHSRTPENVARLLAALKSIDATYPTRPDKRFEPTATLLSNTGHHLFTTTLSIVDVLGSTSFGWTYEDLAPHAQPYVLPDGQRIRVISLHELIAIKTELGRDRDKSALRWLLAIERNLDRSSGQDDDGAAGEK